MTLTEDKSVYVVDFQSTIEDAWTIIDKNQHRSVIVVDGEKVVGTLSDGDLRKAMLAKRILSTPVHEVMNVNFIFIKDNEREPAENIMKERSIFLLPVVDELMVLLDIIIR